MNHLQLRPLIVVFISLTVITGLIYPLAVTMTGRALFPQQANGSLLTDAEGNVRGSRLIAQSIDDPRYFQSRPAASTGTASNLSPVSTAFIAARHAREQAWIARGGTTPVPLALLTTSASGLDPHLPPEAVYYQAPLVAKARGWGIDNIHTLIAIHTQKPLWGFLGEARVNVLTLNMALDASSSSNVLPE